jgi:hypothetical protein
MVGGSGGMPGESRSGLGRVNLHIPDGPLVSNSLTYSVDVVPTSGATIAENSFIITVLDTVTH